MSKNIHSSWSRKEILWLIGGSIIFLAIIGVVMGKITKPQPLATGESFPILESKHIGISETPPPYNSNPPTSGNHYVEPANWAVYETELPDEQLIHNLEHGGIWISYKDIDQDTQSKLEKLTRQNSGSVVMAPRTANEAKIIFTSWGRMQKFESFDEEAMALFIQANKNRSPEPIAR